VWNRCDVGDIKGNAIVAYLEARNRGQDEASAIRCGVQAADRARRPPGTRSKGVRFLSDELPAVARAADIASATPPNEGNAMGVFSRLPEVPRQVAYAIIVCGATVAEAAEALEMTQHGVRRQLARAKKMAAEMLTEGDRTNRGRVLKPW
jgi:DNA-directed RNA polymerase specialized sigma24 family protein